MIDITSQEITEWKAKWDNAKTIGEGKQIGREFRDKFNLRDLEAINYLNGKVPGGGN